MGILKDKIVQILDKIGCHHEWQNISNTKVEVSNGETYHIYLFHCKKCGKFKKVKNVDF